MNHKIFRGKNTCFLMIICSLFLLGVIVKSAVFYYPSIGNGVYNGWLSLDFYKIMQGEWWRFLTFVINPPGLTILWSVLAIAFTYIIGWEIVELIGGKKILLYYFLSFMIQIAIAAAFFFEKSRVIWMDLSFWGWTLFPVLAWISPKKKVYLLTPFSLDIKMLLLIPTVLFILKWGMGSYSVRINLCGQMLSMLSFLLIEIKDRKYLISISTCLHKPCTRE